MKTTLAILMLGAIYLSFFPKPCTRQCGGRPRPARSPMASDIRWLRVETPSVPTHANMYGMEQELFDKSFLPQVLMRLHSHQVAIASQFLQTLQ